MKKLTALASASIIALFPALAQADYALNILHINDLHSRIESINKYDSTCDAKSEEEGKCFGGIARVKTLIEDRRVALSNSNVLVLDAGDQFQGSLFYSTYKGDAAVQFLNSINPDAMAVGNHEFDNGPETLAAFIDKANFPVISGNTSVYTEPLLKDKLNGYVIVEKGGQKIGIVSVLATDTGETSSPGENVKWIDTVGYLKTIIPEIESKGVNKIIAVTHVGLEEDKRIAAETTGIDVIVGGHSHTLLSNTQKRAEGPYPVMVKNPDGINVPIVQAYAYSKFVGELRVNFSDDGIVKTAVGEPHLLDKSVEPDSILAAKVASLGEPIEALKKKVIGATADVVDGDRNSCRLGECTMGNLVADAILDRVAEQGVTIAIQNSGGLRASIDAGETTMGEVLTVLPFQNTLATFGLKGSDIIASLENGVSQTEEVKGRFPQVAGLRFAWDETVEPLKGRVKQVQVKDGDKWVDIDPDKEYQVASNNFMRSGGDGYKLFKTSGTNAYDYGPGLEEVVAAYIEKNSPYKPFVDGRILKGAMFGDAMQKEAIMKKPETMAKSSSTDYTIKQGDTLWKIAIAQFNDPTMWKEIETLNGVDNVRNLKVGDVIKLPVK